MPNIYTKLTKQEVIGVLKATGSRDKDVLYAAKEGQLKLAWLPKFSGTIFMIAGVGLTLTIIGSPIGIPMFFAGWWLRRRGTTSSEAVEAAYTEYTAAL
jgi:uncharacterized membrane protein YgdD (TMEM256/DUF423 family)